VAIDLAEGTFRAFGSDCRVVSDLPAGRLQPLVDRADDLEQRWSRFRPDSEVSRCNAARGRAVPVSSATVDLFERANAAAERTAGRFNPLLLGDMVALGYDRDHGELASAASEPELGMRPAVVDRRIETVEIGADGVRVPAHAAFDPGGLGKGLAADILLHDLLEDGARWAYVSLGGDMRFGGDALAEQGTPVAIENPWMPGQAVGDVTVFGGAVASSSVLRRTWQAVDGATHHHLLDPTTRRPVRGARVAATVHARDAWWADVVAKCCLIDDDLGADQIIEWGCVGLAFTTDRTLEPLGWMGSGED
jgi:thiamine biosynthesis lipoprotein